MNNHDILDAAAARQGPDYLSTTDPDFFSRLNGALQVRRHGDDTVRDQVARLIRDVRERGDQAVAEATYRFDGHNLSSGYSIGQAALREAWDGCDALVRGYIDVMYERVSKYARQQMPEDTLWTDEDGVELGWKWTAMDSAGLYVPGGTASYPSSVVMLAVPAAVAGVKRIVITVPAPGGKPNQLVLAAAHRCGVSEVFPVGGVQAIAALTYGTASISPVDCIAGPGNQWVTEAKRQVYGDVGIDMIAGPSEVAIIVDDTADPELTACDLLAQAEHDTEAQSVLISRSKNMLDATCKCVAQQLITLPRGDIAAQSWSRHGLVILAISDDEIATVTNQIAPEHLQIVVESPDHLLEKIRNAGAIFVGNNTPEVLGDYLAGPSHVLPTTGAARFASGVGSYTFMKRSSITRFPKSALGKLGPVAASIARCEGLEGHARTIDFRLQTGRDCSTGDDA